VPELQLPGYSVRAAGLLGAQRVVSSKLCRLAEQQT
jgi:hypothetical protein